MQTTKTWINSFLCLSLILLATICPDSTFAQVQPAPATATAPAVPMPPANPMAILKAIPADATGFIVVRNLNEMNKDVSGVAMKLGFPLGPMGMIPAPLDLMKMKTGIMGGLSENSSLALVVLNCKDVPAINELANAGKLAVIIPSHDIKALTATMNPQKQDDLTIMNFMGEQFFSAPKGDFLVVAKAPEAVKAVLKAGDGIAKTMSPDQIEAYRKQDLFAWFSPAGISQEIRDEINTTLSGMMTMAYQQSLPGLAQQTTEDMNKFFEQTKEVSLGLDLDADKGLNLSIYFRVKPGTEFAEQMAAVKTADKPLLAGLPDEPFVVAAGFTNTMGHPQQEKQIRMVLDLYANMAKQAGLEITPQHVESIKETVITLSKSYDSGGFSISALPSASIDGLIGIAKVTRVKDSQQFQADTRKLIATVKEIFLDLAKKDSDAELTEEDITTLDQIIVYKENAEQIAGANVDHFIIDLSKIPAIDPETLVEIKNVVGAEGVIFRIAAVGKNHIVATFGGGKDRFTKIVELAKKDQAPLAQSNYIKKIAGRLPAKNLYFEGYFSVEHLLSLIMNVASAAGQPIPLPLALSPAAPIAFNGSIVDKTAQQVDIHVPIELVISVKQAIGPLMGMMMGGMGGQPGMPGAQTQPSQGL